MFCPECRAEFRDEIQTCDECGVSLVSELPPEVPDPGSMVEVFRTAEPTLLPVVKSVLEGAEIPYFVQGDEAVGLLPLGKAGSGFFGDALRAIVHVPLAYQEEARALLESEFSADAEPENG